MVVMGKITKKSRLRPAFHVKCQLKAGDLNKIHFFSVNLAQNLNKRRKNGSKRQDHVCMRILRTGQCALGGQVSGLRRVEYHAGAC